MRKLAYVVLLLGLLVASGLSVAHSKAADCSSLARLSGAALGEPSARIVSTALNPQSEARIDPTAPPWASAVPAMPAHCEVQGVMRERTGTDGQRYAVKFRLRLPLDWNGRFLFQGGGGTNGMLGDAAGVGQPGMPTALEQGFAVVSTDTGHDNALNFNPDRQGTVSFGHDYEARLEYSEKALDSVASTAKRIIRRFYGRSARFSYFSGCSNGGREGMVFAQRFPAQFDGIVAAAPAFAVPKAAIAEAWDTQTFAALARKSGTPLRNGMPDIARTFSSRHLGVVAEAVLEACDADDGITDGMVQQVAQCTTARVIPQLEARRCTAAASADCLSDDQIEALVRSLGGPRNSSGEALYAEWPWDPGIAGPGWRIWKIGDPDGMEAINVTLGSPALSGLFVTPPAIVPATVEANLGYQLEFDFDRDAPGIFGTNAQFPRSGWDLVGAQSTDLLRFKRRGGRMIVPHGSADPIFSIRDSFDWWRAVDAATRGGAAGFVRVYAVPGMNHCTGGPATDQFDALAAVVDWVEKGKSPARIEAKAGAMTPWPGRTRPLCPFPQHARYRAGDIEQSGSFICE